MADQTSFKSGFIILIGRPNSGKSSLMNMVLGEQLSIVTPLPQTTRRALKGIHTDKQMQLIFVDTPGIHKGKHVFNNSMIKEAKNALKEGGIEIVGYLVDLSRSTGEEEEVVAELVSGCESKVLLIFNKIDICKNPDSEVDAFYKKFPHFSNAPSIRISALKKDSKNIFLSKVKEMLPEGPKYFDEEDLTDSSLRFFASEYIRKHIILNTREEVPHATFVEIESYREEPDSHHVEATIHVETIGQRGILVGKNGSVISKIRKEAEREMESLAQVPVKVNCHIKVTPKWRDNEYFLRQMGMPLK